MALPAVNDRQIVAQVLDGDIEAYRLLVDRYLVGLVNHLYNLVGDSAQAEDLAQEAFIHAYQKLRQYKSEYAFSTWLYKIADNMAYRHLKQNKRVASLDIVEDLPADQAPVSEKLDRQAERIEVRRAITRLKPNYQRVVSLYYWDNFSYQEIAVILDQPIGTIRTWLNRAKHDLRKELYG